VSQFVCFDCTVEKILFGLPPTVTVVKDDDTILDAVRRNSLLPASQSGMQRASLSAPPPLITHTEPTPHGSPNDSSSTPRHALSPLLHCPQSFNGDTAQSPHHRV